MPSKPTTKEEEYFARQEAEKKQKLALEHARALADKEREERKRLHWMQCPKCGMELQTIDFGGVDVDRCFSCDGTWLDAGELEQLAAREDKQPGVLGAMLRVFGGGRKKKQDSHP